MIRFDRIEKDRMYLGFTQEEIDLIVSLLEEHRPDDEMTNRLDVLAMKFMKKSYENKRQEG